MADADHRFVTGQSPVESTSRARIEPVQSPEWGFRPAWWPGPYILKEVDCSNGRPRIRGCPGEPAGTPPISGVDRLFTHWPGIADVRAGDDRRPFAGRSPCADAPGNRAGLDCGALESCRRWARVRVAARIDRGERCLETPATCCTWSSTAGRRCDSPGGGRCDAPETSYWSAPAEARAPISSSPRPSSSLSTYCVSSPRQGAAFRNKPGLPRSESRGRRRASGP